METLVHSSVEDPAELHLLTTWQQDSGRFRKAGLLSVSAHAAAIIALLLVPRTPVTPPQRVEQVTPLIEPLTELTQKMPNKAPVAKEVSVEGLQPHPHIQVPNSPPSTTRPAARLNSPPPQPPPAPMPEPPQIQAGNRDLQPLHDLPVGPPNVQPPPQIQEQEKPKLAFETPTAPPPSNGVGRFQRPDTSVAGAIRELTHGGGGPGSMTVGDDTSDVSVGGRGSGLNLPASPGRQASSLELLSDPKGVDFRPYLLQVLAAVRRNWFAVYPESASMGLRGRVETEFVIARDGSIPKLVIVLHSVPALERAAVAGIDASHPFPPFPSEFTGDRVVLKLTFSYNMPRK
ncbi:MAG TPA: TonB family protein [Bryobacteraceae bacterium]|jgi:TonB family protein|nr:TonB family protein [Bryobacteraceae bacterium]